MGRADLDQAQFAAADLELELSREGAGRGHEPHLVELEGRERLAGVGGDHGDIPAPRIRERQRAGEPQSARQRPEALHLGGGLILHDRRGRLGGDDLRSSYLLVSPPVVTVGVGVDERFDWRVTDQWRHRGEHAACQPRIPQRVDQQRRAVADHQARVALTEQSVRLQPGVDARTDLGKASLVSRRTGMKGRDRGHGGSLTRPGQGDPGLVSANPRSRSSRNASASESETHPLGRDEIQDAAFTRARSATREKRALDEKSPLSMQSG